MRLIDTSTLAFREFQGDCTEPYAILSHTWGDEECSLQDMASPGVTSRKGFAKIKLCCKQALADGFRWAWVDTCCIDKTSTAELTEAINSMFHWYRQAKVCYAYLTDISSIEELSTSRWFTRGWTLQELIAPRDVQFYSSDWTLIGRKSDDVLSRTINSITGIESFVLITGEFASICAGRRMSWAANRETTRIEDRAYSLFSLFGVNMPLIYGEGQNAFLRLQQQVLMDSEDFSILAWGLQQPLEDADVFGYGDVQYTSRGPFAMSPSDFATPHVILQAIGTNLHDPTPPTAVGSAVTIRAAITVTL